MAQWAWSSPFRSDQSPMEADLLSLNDISEGSGEANLGFERTEEESEPDYDEVVQPSVTDEVPDYEIESADDDPDYDDRPQGEEEVPSTLSLFQTDTEGRESDVDQPQSEERVPSTLVLIPTDSEGSESHDSPESIGVKNDVEVVPTISDERKDSASSGIESFVNGTGSFTLYEDYEDALDAKSVRTMDPETLRIKSTWRRGVAPLLVQGANTIRLRRRDVEAAMEEAGAVGQRSKSKADFTIFIDEKKKQSMVVDEEENKRAKKKRRRAEKRKQRKSKLKDLFGFSLWATTFKEIEGHFGGATVSYFRFVRWLLVVNLLSSLVITASTVLPQILLPPRHFQDTVNCSAYPTTTANPEANYTLRPEWNVSLAPETTTPSFVEGTNDTEMPPEIANYRDEIGISQACRCSEAYMSGIEPTNGRMWYLILLDILQGTEWMELSVLFIGYYFDKPLYLSSLAFLFATIACFGLILWAIILHIASSLRTNIVESPGANKQRYSEQVLGCWDHNLTNEKAAGRKKKQFYCQIITEMQKDLEDRRQKQRSRAKRVGIFILRLIVAILVAALIVAAGVFLFLVVTDFVLALRDVKIADAGLQELFNLLLQYLPSMALTFVNTLLPLLFQLILRLALLTEETQFAVLLVLMVFTRLSSVAFLVIVLFTQIYSCQSNACHTCPEMPCWENRLGQHMYTLAIIDFLTVCFSFLATIIFGRCCCARSKKTTDGDNGEKEGGMEFNVSSEVLSAVYTQTICWIGAFFCPLILPITSVKLFFYFYMKKKVLFCCCVPSSRINRASRFNFFFMIVTLISLVICYFTVSIAIGWLHPSQGCSPFRVYSEPDFYMYRSFHFVTLSWPSDAQDFFEFISSWAFLFIVSVASMFGICLFAVMASRNRRMASHLEQELLLESQDKLYLYRRAEEGYLRNELDA